MVKVKIAGTNKQEPQPGQSKGARKLRETKRMEIRIPQFQKEKKRHDVTSKFEFHEQMKIHQYTHASREFYDCHDKKKNLQTTQFSQAEEDLNTGSEPHALVEGRIKG